MLLFVNQRYLYLYMLNNFLNFKNKIFTVGVGVVAGAGAGAGPKNGSGSTQKQRLWQPCATLVLMSLKKKSFEDSYFQQL